MPRNALRIQIDLDRIHCHDEGDGWGSAGPRPIPVPDRVLGLTNPDVDDDEIAAPTAGAADRRAAE